MATESQLKPPAAATKPSYRIKSICVSLELADKNFGSDTANSATIQAHVDDASLGEINDVINAGLMLYVAAWRNCDRRPTRDEARRHDGQ
jgi:hypothetical protein